MGNLFDQPGGAADREVFDPLVSAPDLLLERIVSHGQATPPGQWLTQSRNEWVVVLRGSAGLRFQGKAEVVGMRPGDYLLIPANTPHRVEWTDQEHKTVWLALHYL